ncbi:KR domain-containing protein [Penicillium maclennaniae]|uniref:KR domain-containing protein n=1 Tax=Penicillium maclennaniae TaxID=1343394 RepID=UPI0025423C16|nr:KR domain-containing protein [Penicillium maclennaniae]KAJ5666286.1 KR domain-containing protein [Penicillium maclennaniae]
MEEHGASVNGDSLLLSVIECLTNPSSRSSQHKNSSGYFVQHSPETGLPIRATERGAVREVGYVAEHQLTRQSQCQRIRYKSLEAIELAMQSTDSKSKLTAPNSSCIGTGTSAYLSNPANPLCGKPPNLGVT